MNRSLLSIAQLSPPEIHSLLSHSKKLQDADAKNQLLAGKTIGLLFYETSTRTRISFENAIRRLGATPLSLAIATSSVQKGETLADSAKNLAALGADGFILRHPDSGAAELLSRSQPLPVINAGDGMHAHPTQALLDALTIRRNKGRIEGLTVAICGDVLHSRVARSNIILLGTLGARVRVVAPSTLLPPGIERFGVEVMRDMREGLEGCDIVMMLRLQRERMNGSFVPSVQEYAAYFGLDQKKLAYAKPDALVMHPGPMNRGVEIDSLVADGASSLIREQVEMGVAVRMAVLEALSRNLPNA